MEQYGCVRQSLKLLRFGVLCTVSLHRTTSVVNWKDFSKPDVRGGRGMGKGGDHPCKIAKLGC